MLVIMNKHVKCIICKSGCQSQNVGEIVDNKLLNNLVELKLAFSLLCKLVSSVTGSVSWRISKRKEHKELLKLLDDFSLVSLVNGNHVTEIPLSPVPLSACDPCRKALQEILRVEREIEDLKNSQWIHVNALKRSLLLLDINTNDNTGDVDEGDYWEVIRRQLIACLQRSDSREIQTSAESSSRRRSGRSRKTVNYGKSSPVTSLLLPHAFVDSPVLKPCSVKLSRCNAVTKATGDDGGTLVNIHSLKSPPQPLTPSPKGRPTRKSKQKACDLLRRSLVTSNHTDDEQEDEIPCGPLDDECSANKASDDPRKYSRGGDYGENFEDWEHPIKQENEDDLEDDTGDKVSWMDWSTAKDERKDVKIEMDMEPGLEPENYQRHTWTPKTRKEAVAPEKGSKVKFRCAATSAQGKSKNNRNNKIKVVKESLLMSPSANSRRRPTAVKPKSGKAAMQSSNGNKTKEEEATRLNILEENMYMYNCTLIKYSTEEGHFICQEPECGALISGTLLDTSNLLSSIKTHVEERHGSSEQNLEGVARSCPFCSFACVGPPNLLRKHIEGEHTKLKKITSILCEICGRRCVNADVRAYHIWTHRNFQDKMDALQAGEEFPYQHKVKLSRHPLDPFYPIIFPDGAAKVKKNKTERKWTVSRKIKVPYRHKVSSKFNFVYCLPQNMYLYRYTLFKYSAEERHFVCQEADCSEEFPEWKDSVISVMKNHVFKTHHYRWSIVEAHSRTCPLCFKECGRLQRFHQHMLQEHHSKQPEALILCEICLKPLCASDNYMRHVSTHIPPEYPSKIILSTSVTGRGAVEDELVPCKICGKKYTMYSLKYHHLPRHEAYEKRRKYECPQCNKQFVTAHGLRNHTERIHRASDQNLWVKCSVPGCDKSFYKRDTFRINEHLQQHKGGAQWICDLCGKSFSLRSSFNEHHRSVHEPKKFQCEECGKKFSRPFNLKKHKEQQHG